MRNMQTKGKIKEKTASAAGQLLIQQYAISDLSSHKKRVDKLPASFYLLIFTIFIS